VPPDTWHPRDADILGSPIAVLAGAGRLVQVLRQPLDAASMAALVVMSLLWPASGGPEPMDTRADRPRRPAAPRAVQPPA